MMADPGFSQRIGRIGVSATMRVFVAAAELRSSGADVVDFSAGEPDFPTPDHIKQAAIRAIEGNFTRYTSAGGTLELREAVCARHRADFATGYQPSECVVSAGGKHAIFNLIQILVGAGDEVVIPVPYWVTYNDVVEYAGGRPVFVETGESDGFRLTAAMVEAKLTPKTRMVIVNSPSNPSGAVLGAAEFERLYEITARRGIYILTDECYGRLLYDGAPFSAASLPGAKRTVLVAGSLSKTYAMTGWRIGYSLTPEPIAQAALKLQSHSTSNPNSIAQKAALEALRGPQDAVSAMLAEYRRRRDFVVGRLRRIPGVRCAEPQGAFYAYPNVADVLKAGGIRNTEEFSERLLREQMVAVVPGAAFGTHEHIRLSYAASMRDLERGLDRIHAFAASLMG